MEALLLSTFSEHLTTLVPDFSPAQISSSLLTGRGEITAVDLNCAHLNALLRSYLLNGAVRLESVHVTRLGFNVTSFANIKRSPIEVSIDEVHVRVVESLDYDDGGEEKEAASSNSDTAKDGSTSGSLIKRPYGLSDRIADNLHLSISRIYVTFQPLGKLKTRRVGPWTPPSVGITLRNLRYVSVDEFGEEGTPDAVWRHNDRQRRQRRAEAAATRGAGGAGCGGNGGKTKAQHDIFIYKKLTLGCSVGLRPPAFHNSSNDNDNNGDTNGDSSTKPPPAKLLLKSVPVQVNLTYQKRKSDAAFLAAQADAVIDDVEILDIDHHTVPLVASLAAALQFLLAKDRSFVDPLKANDEGAAKEGGNREGGGPPADEGIEMTLEEDEANGGNEEALASNAPTDLDGSGGVDDDEASESSSDEEEEDAPIEKAASASALAPAAAPTAARTKKFHPAYVFSSGTIIHNRVSLSLSVHRCTVRAWYGPSASSPGGGGYLQCVLKGLVAEAIWPPKPGDRGGIAQMSLSYISLQERHGKALRPLLYGGQQVQPVGSFGFKRTKANIDGNDSTARVPDMMVSAPDITFPLFEDRSIRLDGYGRESLPSQAVGLKVTVDVHDHDDPAKRAEGKTQMSFLSECGMDRIDVVLDSDAYCRALSFGMNGEEGVDPRLFSGDWSDWLTADMFVSPGPNGAVPSLEPYLQPMPGMFLDENHLMSSELFNLTSKMTNIRLRLPAPVHADVKCNSIVVGLSDLMVLVSSALPRTILGGKISPSSDDEDGRNSFPNDPSDISANMSKINDIMSAGADNKEMRSSTFRVQVTMDGLSVEAKPAIPLHDAVECQTLILPTKMSCLLCIDVTAPPTAHTRKGMGIAAHISAHLQQLQMNLDVDVIVGIVSCLLYHAERFQKTIQNLFPAGDGCGTLASARPSVEEAGGGSLDNVLKSQVSRSFESGIVVKLSTVHVDELDVKIWRQECRLKAASDGISSRTPYPVLLLARIRLTQLQIGVEAAKGMFDTGGWSLATKAGLSSFRLDLVDPTLVPRMGSGSDAMVGLDKHEQYMTGIFHLVENNQDDTENDTFLRLDYNDASKVASVSIEINSAGSLHLKLDAVELAMSQVIEGLFIPTGIHHVPSNAGVFPEGSLGGFIVSLVGQTNGEKSDSEEISNDASADTTGSMLHSIQAVAFRVSAKKLDLIIPIAQSTYNYNLQLQNVSASAGFFQQHDGDGGAIESWIGRKSSSRTLWSSDFNDIAPGLHFVLESTQSVAQTSDTDDSTETFLVRPFSVCGAYHPESTQVKMGEMSLTFSEAQIIQQIADTGIALGKSAYEIYLDVASLHSSLDSLRSTDEGAIYGAVVDISSSPAEITSREALSSISAAQSMLSSIETEVTSLANSAKPQQDENMRRDLERTKTLVFLLERQRTAALSLVSARVCGWIRFGASNVSGQRIITATNLWRYWAVLRKNLLIICDRPGGAKVIDIIPLSDMTLHSISGQNKRTDVARGFALRDSRGYERILSCATG